MCCIGERGEELKRAAACFLFTASQIFPGVCSGIPVSPTLLCSQFFLQLFCLPAAPACRLVLNDPLAVVVVLGRGDWFAETSFTWAFEEKGCSKYTLPAVVGIY